jgi:hypothetical protein
VAPFVLPDILRSWIDANVIGIGSIDSIRFIGCRRIPFWWIPGNKDVLGLTLWSRVYIAMEECAIDPASRSTVEIIFPELIHVAQFQKAPLWFPVKYLWNHLRYGYINNPAEVEARTESARLAKEFFRLQMHRS